MSQTVELFVPGLIVRLLISLRRIALNVVGMTATSAAAVQDPHTMDQIDLDSPRVKAAMKIVDCINNSVNLEQLKTTSLLISLFESKYGNNLPLRAWWHHKVHDLTFYPPNA